MRLEEAIEREEYRVEQNIEMADSFHTDENVYGREEEAYRNRAEYHRQLAEWLRELKAWREAREEIVRKMNSGQWSDAVIFGMAKAIVIIDKTLFAHNCNKEVNADDT